MAQLPSFYYILHFQIQVVNSVIVYSATTDCSWAILSDSSLYIKNLLLRFVGSLPHHKKTQSLSTVHSFHIRQVNYFWTYNFFHNCQPPFITSKIFVSKCSSMISNFNVFFLCFIICWVVMAVEFWVLGFVRARRTFFKSWIVRFVDDLAESTCK